MLTQDIAHDLTQAMKSREEPKLSALRMLKSELQKLQADKGRGAEITDDDVHTVIRRLIKQRKDAAEQYRAGGANDRAESELAEIGILEPYLPKQLGDDEIDAIISQSAKELGLSSPKDMGRLMKAVMSKAKGQADGARVKERVTACLNK
ncbi:MAG: GatB/YqeY domain-containing protein [Synergistaceae bacterium]|nr:GatB/YqeY domain-containing protein [Synergistaceae bacterium]